MDFPQNMSMEEAFALAEAEAKLNAALAESKARFENAEIPNRLNEDWRFGRPHKYAKELAELLQSNTPCTGSAEVQGCDEEAVIINATSRTDTYPAISVNGNASAVQHEASVSQVDEEMLFYMQQRGLTRAQAMSLAVNGFINDLVKEFPMEYSVELRRLIDLEMEDSIG